MPKLPPPLSDEDRLLCRHILDLSERSERTGRALYSTFLDDRQLAFCEAALKSDKRPDFATFGGYPEAERRIIAFNDPEGEVLPEGYELSHRDFLGSLMALGIKRELLGDILVGTGRTAVFVYDTVFSLVSDMTKVGRVGVKVSFDFSEADIPEPDFEEIHTTLASLRLDALVASALKMSRETAAELIRQKGVMQNRVLCFSPSERVSEGDRFSVRGFGRFDLSEVKGQSRKDRTIITVKRYR